MKFTVALADLESLLKAVLSRPRKDDTLILSACAGRVFIECKGDGAGIEALVLSDGAVTFPAQRFGDLLETYKGTGFLTFECGADGLHVQHFSHAEAAADSAPSQYTRAPSTVSAPYFSASAQSLGLPRK